MLAFQLLQTIEHMTKTLSLPFKEKEENDEGYLVVCPFFFCFILKHTAVHFDHKPHGGCLLMNYTWLTFCITLSSEKSTTQQKIRHAAFARVCIAYSCFCVRVQILKCYVGLKYCGIFLPALPSQDRFLSYSELTAS